MIQLPPDANYLEKRLYRAFQKRIRDTKILIMRVQGFKLREIAEKYNITIAAVSSITKKRWAYELIKNNAHLFDCENIPYSGKFISASPEPRANPASKLPKRH